MKVNEMKPLIQDDEELDEDDQQQLAQPEASKKLGREAFQRNDIRAAITHFSKAIQQFQSLIQNQLIKTSEIMAKYIEDIEIPCNSNLAICYLKLKDYNQCVVYASKVIDVDPTNVKAFYRRGMAYLNMNEFKDARANFTDAFKLDPKNKEIQLAFEQLQEKKAKMAEKSKEVGKTMMDHLDYSDKVRETEYKRKMQEKSLESESTISKKGIVGQLIYDVRVILLVIINFFLEKFCERRVPSQYFSKID